MTSVKWQVVSEKKIEKSGVGRAVLIEVGFPQPGHSEKVLQQAELAQGGISP